MSIFSKLKLSALWLLLLLAGLRAEGQGIVLSATSSANFLLVSNILTYTIKVTNNLAFLPGAAVSNTLPATVQFVGATQSQGTSGNFNNVTVFNLGGFNVGTFATLTLTVRPTAAGNITNLVEFFTLDATNAPIARVVTRVTNANPAQVDLGVSLTVPNRDIIVGDTMSYAVTATNAGPAAVSAAMLTNTLPPGVVLKNVSPTSPGYAVIGSNLVFNLGTLTNGSGRTFQVTLQPTNVGVLDCFAAIGAAGVAETNLANNIASNHFTVINYLPGDLVAVTNSAQIINPQNGLIEQSVLVANLGTNEVPSVRLVVTGLTNRLVNAVATNSGSPYVVHAAPLAAGSNVSLLLQYAPRKNFPFTNSQLQAYAVPLPDLAPPAGTVSSTNIAYTRIVMLPGGNPLVEFPSVLGRTYTIIYSDNLLFSNALTALPSIVAPGNQVQWIDYGPPTTVSLPANNATRYYRVYLNP